MTSRHLYTAVSIASHSRIERHTSIHSVRGSVVKAVKRERSIARKCKVIHA